MAYEDAEVIESAIALLLERRIDEARDVLASLSPTDPIAKYDGTSSPRRSEPPLTRKPLSARTSCAVFIRDGWRCRYCRRKVVFPYVPLLLTILCPGFRGALPEFRFKAGTFEPAVERVYPTVDHVDPRVHDPSNLVTACSPCNYRKSDRRWIPTNDPGRDSWDGLTAAYLRLMALHPVPMTQKQKDWNAGLSLAQPKSSLINCVDITI